MASSIAEIDARLTAPGERFEIEVTDIRGVPTRTWKHAPRTLPEILTASRRHGDRVFLVYEDERTTFEEHFRAAAHLAHVLRDRYGVAPGDRVAIAMRNFPEWPIAFWGATAAGAVVVPLNAWWTADELEYGLTDSGTAVLIADAERVVRLEPHLRHLDLAGTVAVRADGAVPPGVERWEEALGEVPADVTLPEVDLHPDDDATIFYTSGTTGRPKGALGTHRNICTNLQSLRYVGARNQVRAAELAEEEGRSSPGGSARAAGRQAAYLLSVPFFHATGCHSVLLSNTAAGSKLVMMYRWDAGRALELIEREEITSFGGVPAMVMQVLDHPDFPTRDTSTVVSIGYGGAPAPPELVRRIRDEFGDVVSPSNGYGLTETSSITTSNGGVDYLRKPDSVGPPVPVCEIAVVDEQERALPTGAVGELWIKGPNVVKGYWNKPEETAEAFVGGWLRSGDVARVDDDGFVYIVDRAKDMVIRGGENIYCVEVESALHEHPAVADCAVIGIPHDTLGEEPAAVVQVRPGTSPTEEELQRHVRTKLAAFKVPVRIWFRSEELPRSPQGKILKRELRDELAGV